MSDIELLQKDLQEILEELKTLPPGSRAHRKLTEERADIDAQLSGSGAIAQGPNSLAAGQDRIGIGGGVGGAAITGWDGNQIFKNSNVTIVVKPDGAKEFIGEQQVEMSAKLRKTAIGRYLEHIIAHNRYLQLQGIRSGGKLVNIELEQIYITLRATLQNRSGSRTERRRVQAEEEWLKNPGLERRAAMERRAAGLETVNAPVEQALVAYRHLVILGDPGSGKTTLLRYLALLYGRDLAQSAELVKTKLQLNESGYLPILLPLRQIGQFLKAHRPKDDGTEEHGLLLDFLLQSLKNHMLDLPVNFFDAALEKGQALVLLDGLDEVADVDLRARAARLVEAFTLAYPACRFVVTSRVVGYSDAARLGVDYVTTTVRDFTLNDTEEFLKRWHRLVVVGQMGPDAGAFAAGQIAQLLNAIQANERVRELTINPLMLTAIALVHHDQVKLPDQRAELYAELVDVLLGKWGEARRVGETAILGNRPFDAGDRRLLLQAIALTMHEHVKKELEAADLLWGLLQSTLLELGANGGEVTPSVYDTAMVLWLAPLSDTKRWLTVKWLLKQLQPDGAWGDVSMPLARDATTLAAILAIKSTSQRADDLKHVDAALDFLQRSATQWRSPLPDNLPGGVELILPRLVEHAVQMGLPISLEPYHALAELRQKRLRIIESFSQQQFNGTTAAHVFEGWGTSANPEILDSMGSIGHSPAATAYWLRLAQQSSSPDVDAVEHARAYLQSANQATGLDIPGLVPTSWPLGYFESIFSLWAIHLAGLSDHPLIQNEVYTQMTILDRAMSSIGIGFTSAFSPDGDDTAVAVAVLRAAGHPVSLKVLDRFNCGYYFCAWAGELQSSVTVTAHALYALGKEKALTSVELQPYFDYLFKNQLSSGLWAGDKWNNSELYATSQILLAFLACEYYEPISSIVESFLACQCSNGGWGTEITTVDETAYVALAFLQVRNAGLLSPVAQVALQQAGHWLLENYGLLQEDIPLCWLGKELYGVRRISQISALAATIAIRQVDAGGLV